MVTLTDHTATGINVLSVGVEPGPTANVTENARLLNEYASDGFSLYFPPGEYYVNSPILFNGQNKIKIWGDAASITQTVDLIRLFDLQDCDNVEISGLTLRSYYYANRNSAGGASQTSLIYTDLCNAVRVHDNLIEGFQSLAVRIGGGVDIAVRDNMFRDGKWLIGGNAQQQDTACIDIWTGTGGIRARDVMISNNHCNVQTTNGIRALHAMRKAVVSDNVVISRDENGVPDEGYNAQAMKSCIDLNYYADAARGYAGDDNEDFDGYSVTGNTVQGARFAGITGQSSLRADAVHAGIRATITGNNVRHCGTSNNAGATSYLQGGIVWAGYRDLNIQGNTINNIPWNGGGSQGTSAISILGIWARHDGVTDMGTPSSCNVSNNIISTCGSRGIYVVSQSFGAPRINSGDVNVCNNILNDIDSREYIRVVVPAGTYRSGHVHVQNNKCAGSSKVTVGSYICRLEVGTVEPAEVIVSGNTFNFRDAIFPVASRPILEIVTHKAIVATNRIIGDGTNGIGLNLRSQQTGAAFDQFLLDTNSIDGCDIGVGSSMGSLYGPFLMNNTTITNCTMPIQQPESVFHGHWEAGKAIIYSDVDPTVTDPDGTYRLGDIIWNTGVISSGVPMGWACTALGTPNTWTPLAVVP